MPLRETPIDGMGVFSLVRDAIIESLCYGYSTIPSEVPVV